MKVEARRLEEAVFEIVEVEEHIVGIKSRLRVALVPVEALCAAELHLRQSAESGFEQLHLAVAILSARLSSASQRIEEGGTSEVALQVAHLIVVDRQYFGHRELECSEMPGQVDESTVLVAAGAHTAND